MADLKISELGAIAAVASADVLPIVDTSLSETNKVSVESLLRSAPAGTAAAPSIAFVDDPDTGFYRSAANELSTSTAGTQRVLVDSTGNVGIGTSSPGERLAVVGNIEVEGNGSLGFNVSDSYADGANYGLTKTAGANPVNLSGFYGLTFGSNSAERVRVSSAGNVGIGTSSPGAKLEVNGTIKATDINFTGLATYADDTAAGTGGLVAGDVYKTSTGELRIKL